MARPARRTTKKLKRPARKPQWLKEGQAFAAVLSERKIGQTEFAERIGRGFHNVHRWTKGHEFTPPNQARAARELGLPDHAFTDAPLPEWRAAIEAASKQQREHDTRAVLAQFKRERPIAKALTPSGWRVLRSVSFADPELRPTVAFFEALAFALMGAIRIDEVVAVARENEDIDRTLAHKPPLKKR